MVATGTDLKYQWQIDRNDGKGFADIAGADRASYTTSAVDKNCNGYKYQCVISNSAGSVTTNAATLTVTESTTPSPDPVSYKILDGANSSWTENTDGSLTIRGNGEMEKFQNVKVDGTTPKGNLTNVRYVVLKANKFDANKPEHVYELKSLVFSKDWKENTNPTDKEIKANPEKYPEYK